MSNSLPPRYGMSHLHQADVNHAAYRGLGYLMAFIGGAINAGGFFAVNHYTSHMSGELARIADHIFLEQWSIALSSALMVLSFILGACHAAFSIVWGKHVRLHSPYALTFWIEAVYMLLFGIMASGLTQYQTLVPITVLLMCFIMGMHNTVMTMLSGGVIRSTHMTGFITDIGIELAKFLFYSMQKRRPTLQGVQWPKLKLYLGLVTGFVLGGVFGAWGFHQVNFKFVLPLSAVLLIIGFSPIAYEVKIRRKVWQRRKQQQNKSK